MRAAIAIADAEGLASVSLRKVGAALDAGAMRLYGYIATKEELLELMVDAVYGEMATTEPVPGEWRDVLRTIAQRTRSIAAVHPWFIELVSGRPHIGPNALQHLESLLAALSNTPGFEDIDDVMQAVGTVNAYVIGAIHSETSKLRAELHTGMDLTQWHAATGPYIERMIATGRFPTITKVVRDATHPPAEVVFAKGLECVLAGVAARFTR